MSPSRLGSWKTMPKLLRAWSWFTWGSRPSSQILPEVGLSSVVSILMVVVLPAPLGPRKAKISPLPTSKEMLSTAVKLPKVLQRFSTRIMVNLPPRITVLNGLVLMQGNFVKIAGFFAEISGIGFEKGLIALPERGSAGVGRRGWTSLLRRGCRRGFFRSGGFLHRATHSRADAWPKA